MKNSFVIEGVFTGKVAPLGKDNFLTAIVKQPQLQEVAIYTDRFGDDEVHDKKHHGGVHRVLHQYPSEHYAYWEKHFSNQATPFEQGSYGENICTLGVTEEDLCIGDVWQIGSATLEVSEARYPCATLNRRYQNPDYLKALLTGTRWGWFYRVLKPGNIRTGDMGNLLTRPHPNLPLALAIDAIMRRHKSNELIKSLIQCPQLSPGWREKASKL